MCAAGFSDSPHFMYSAYDRNGDWYQLLPDQPLVAFPANHSATGRMAIRLWPSFTNVPNEFLESYFPLRIDTYETSPTPAARARTGGATACASATVPRAGRDLDPRRPLAHLPVGRERRAARRAQQEDAGCAWTALPNCCRPRSTAQGRGG